jgi:hypothetical protein
LSTKGSNTLNKVCCERLARHCSSNFNGLDEQKVMQTKLCAKTRTTALKRLQKQNVYKQKDRVRVNTQNPMSPQSGNNQTEDLLARARLFMIRVVPELIVESAFWGKFGIPMLTVCCCLNI